MAADELVRYTDGTYRGGVGIKFCKTYLKYSTNTSSSESVVTNPLPQPQPPQ
ncbi:hypothetical protein Pr1d_16000 [Bythopirellula goksoeyrii]|uniref:Uncharacterized protein n=1 Tax=Bythopirellula goksoeyrii TaxID=1400387 RepID=A0A5B9Q9P4_9BACT|nr:hypothetical protein Pr1d_16000 [Bythopirellula goksoeyrii]